jgi:hypothetical protein
MKRKMDYHNDPESELNDIDIIESPIDPSLQKEYHDLSDSIDFDNVNYGEVLAETDQLFVAGTPIEAKKRMLILLAHLGTMESVKVLEKYLKVAEEDLKDWVVLSLKECRMFVENVFLNDTGGFISTGLGGKGNRLRYYFIVSTKEGRTLTGAGKETLQEAFKGSSGEYGSEIEEITIGNNYVMVGILIPMDVAVGEVIEEGIRQCNRTEEFLLSDYYVTNVNKPTEEEISRYLKDIRQHKK